MNKINKKEKFGFSLIELSIVLIIIGILVAGITGGASLIESARLRALVNEITEYKQAFLSFVVAKGRFPGDLNNDGYIGYCLGLGCPSVTTPSGAASAETYTSSSFPSPYNISGIGHDVAPFIDLYLEKMINYKPDPESLRVPDSNVFKSTDSSYVFRVLGIYSAAQGNKLNNTKPGSVFNTFFNYYDNKKYSKYFKSIDAKYDDGKYDSGSIIGTCAGNGKTSSFASYDEAINDKDNGKCTELWYKIY